MCSGRSKVACQRPCCPGCLLGWPMRAPSSAMKLLLPLPAALGASHINQVCPQRRLCTQAHSSESYMCADYCGVNATVIDGQGAVHGTKTHWHLV